MIIIALIIIGISLYWIGGQKWANTWFRDAGVPLCMLAIAWLALGWSWWLLGLVIAVGGSTIGDHDKWYWSIHGFVYGLGMAPYAIAEGKWIPLLIMMTIVTAGTYLVSRFLNKGGWDVIGRGALYATAPLWFLHSSIPG